MYLVDKGSSVSVSFKEDVLSIFKWKALLDIRQVVQPFGQSNTRVGTGRNLDWLLGEHWAFSPSTLEGKPEQWRTQGQPGYGFQAAERRGRRDQWWPANELDVLVFNTSTWQTGRRILVSSRASQGCIMKPCRKEREIVRAESGWRTRLPRNVGLRK